MPEALAIIVVAIVAVGVYIGVWIQSRDPSRQNPRQDLARLQRQHMWLQERLQKARREEWGGEMTASLADELDLTARRLAATHARSERV